MLAIAETFDALTTDRAHRRHQSIDAAISVIRSEAGAQFDPTMVELLERTVREQEVDWVKQIEQGRLSPDDTLAPAAVDDGSSDDE